MRAIVGTAMTFGLVLGACQPSLAPPAAPLHPAAGAPHGAPEIHVRAEESFVDVLHVTGLAALIEARWPDAEPGDWQVLEVLDPGSNVYLHQKQVLAQDGTATARIPLRGSYIDDYRMTGQWHARVYRNSARVPAAETSFMLLP
jgi:hypothetical protein